MIDSKAIDGVDVTLQDLINLQSHLSGLSLRHIRRLNSISNGSRQSRYRGRGMEYHESRAYVVGDDVRTMDWRVMARTGEAHSKIYSEEKEPGLTFLIDLSTSMFYGTNVAFKSWAAIHLAAHLAWLAHLDGDKLGALIASPERLITLKQGKTRQGLFDLFVELVSANRRTFPLPPGSSQLNSLLSESLHSEKPGSAIILISDFLDIDTRTAALLGKLRRRHQLCAYWVYDQSETEDWLPGPYPITVGNRNRIIDTRDKTALNWLRRQQLAHRDRIARLMSDLNIDLQAISCNEDITDQLLTRLNP